MDGMMDDHIASRQKNKDGVGPGLMNGAVLTHWVPSGLTVQNVPIRCGCVWWRSGIAQQIGGEDERRLLRVEMAAELW